MDEEQTEDEDAARRAVKANPIFESPLLSSINLEESISPLVRVESKNVWPLRKSQLDF